jgi:integrase
MATQKIGLYKEKTAKGVQWRVRWFGEYCPGTGKTKRYGKTFERKIDAQEFLASKAEEFKKGVLRDPSKATLKEYAENWLTNKVKLERIRLGTEILYKETLARLYEYFGENSPIRSIDQLKAKNFLSGLQPKMESKTVLSNWTLQRIYRHCKTLFKSVVKDGIAKVNPFEEIKIAKGKPSQWYYLKQLEYLKLLDATSSLNEKVLYALCYTAGLRETEALTLRWVDIDFEKSRLNIVNQKATETLPPFDIKDGEQRETAIPIPQHTINLLTLLQAESPAGSPYVLITGEQFDRVVKKWKDCQETGKRWSYRNWAYNIPRNFNLRVKKAGIETGGRSLTVHTLRKCCIQNWQNYLPMNYVTKFAGHSDSQTTETYYSTIDESRLNDIAQAANKLITDAQNERLTAK